MRRLLAVRRCSSARPALTFAVSLSLLFIVTVAVGAAEPQRLPRRYIPAQGLLAYLEYEGLDAHAAAWQATAAHDMLVKTPAGAMLADVFKQLTNSAIKDSTVGRLDAAGVMAAADHVVRKGFACGVYLSGDDDPGAIVVLNGFGRNAFAERVERLRKFIAFMEPDAAKMLSGPYRIRGREVFRLRDEDTRNPLYIDEPPGSIPTPPDPPIVSAWMENDDLILVFGNCGRESNPPNEKAKQNGAQDPVEIVLDTVEGKLPNVTTHPGFISAVAEGKDLKGFEPNGLFFLELKPEIGGGMVLLGATEIAAEMAFELAESWFASAEPGTGKPHSAPAPDAATAPTPKKDERLALATTDRPKDQPGSKTSKAGHQGRQRKPTKVDHTQPQQPKPASTKPKSKPAAKPQGERATDPQGDEKYKDPSFEDFELEMARELGLDGVKRIVARWGFQGKALLSDVRVETPAPRKGLAAWFDQPAFRTDRLPVIPPDASNFVLASFAPERSYQMILETGKAMGADFNDEVDLEAMIQQTIGVRLREDLLRHIGPSWAVVDVRDRAGPLAKGATRQTVFLAAIDDAAAFKKVADSLARQIDEALRTFEQSEREISPKDKEIGTFGMKCLPAPDSGYRIDLPSVVFKSGIQDPVTLSPSKKTMNTLYFVIGKSSIAVAFDLDRARHVLTTQGPPTQSWKPTGELANALAGLPGNLTFLSVSDPQRCSLPEWIAGLPDNIQYLMVGEAISQDLQNKTCWSVLNLLGCARPGDSRLKINRAHTPKVDELRRCVFASVQASTVDDRGYRFIHREPVPFAGLASEITFHQTWSVRWDGLTWPEMKYLFTAASPEIKSGQ
jgi:hypothetical protein